MYVHCRDPRNVEETHAFALTSIQRLFTCQFSKLHPTVRKNLWKNVKTPAARSVMRSCTHMTGSTQLCISELEQFCLKSDTRILKTIRLTMDLVETLMDVLPNMKVIHLNRDPRGMTNSRLNGPFRMARHLYNHTRDTCARMQNDIDYNNQLKHVYTDRLITVLYEALAERPYDGAEYIYKFLKLDIKWQMIYWVFNSTHSDNTYYFSTSRSNAVASAYRWRKEMNYDDVKLIDRLCVKTYSMLGILPVETEDVLRNLDLPTRQSIQHFDGFI